VDEEPEVAPEVAPAEGDGPTAIETPSQALRLRAAAVRRATVHRGV
jgi:hypothetical protein